MEADFVVLVESFRPYKRCKGGARCVTYAQTGELDRRDINCPFRHTPIPEKRFTAEE